MKRIFADTSVLFAATLSSTGASREIIRMALNDELTLVLSDYVLKAMHQALARKAPESLPALEDFLDSLRYEAVNASKLDVLAAAEYTELKGCPRRCSCNQSQRRLPRESG